MATKYGKEAFIAWGKIQAAFKAKRNLIFGLVIIVVIWLVMDNYFL